MSFEPISDATLRKLSQHQLLQDTLHHHSPSNSKAPSHTSGASHPPTQSDPHPSSNLQPLPQGLFLSDITPKPLEWLWPQRLPLGKLTLLDGPAGLGLSLLSLHLAACISSGTPFPDGTPSQQGTVILISPHDDPSNTIQPRLQAAGADPNHVLLLNAITIRPSSTMPPCQYPFCLPHDFGYLEATIKHHHAVLVIIDPLSAVQGRSRPGTPHQHPNHLLISLAQLAERTHCAILLTRAISPQHADPLRPHHTNNPQLALIRSRLLITPDPSNERRCLLLTPHHPLCTEPDPLTYQIVAQAQNVPTLHWLGSADTTFLARLRTGPIHSPQRQAILRFLQQSPTPQSLNKILKATSYTYESGRKMLWRMQQAGEVTEPSRGFYTTRRHPCLTSNNDTPPPNPSTPVPNVPCPESSISDAPAANTSHQTPAPDTHDTSSVTNVPAVPPVSNPPSNTNDDSPMSHVPAVPPVSDPPSNTSNHSSMSHVPGVSAVSAVSEPLHNTNNHASMSHVPSVPTHELNIETSTSTPPSSLTEPNSTST